MNLLNDVDNKRLSSRRVLGVIYLAVALAMFVASWIMDKPIADEWLTVVIAGGSLLGITSIDHIFKNRGQ